VVCTLPKKDNDSTLRSYTVKQLWLKNQGKEDAFLEEEMSIRILAVCMDPMFDNSYQPKNPNRWNVKARLLLEQYCNNEEQKASLSLADKRFLWTSNRLEWL